MDVTIRRLENNLVTVGTGIIMFGLWAFIKSILTALLIGMDYIDNATEEEQLLFSIASWIFAVLSVLMYLWLGLSARAEGKGKRKSPVYLFFVGMICLFSISAILYEIYTLTVQFKTVDDPVTLLVTIIIDVTRLIFLFELIYSSVMLRRIKKQKEKEVAAA